MMATTDRKVEGGAEVGLSLYLAEEVNHKWGAKCRKLVSGEEL